MKLFRRFFGSETSKQPEQQQPSYQQPDLELPPEEPIAAVPLQTRPLPPPEEFTSSKRRIRYGQASDVGQARSNNQDALLTFLAHAEAANNPPVLGFFLVADGMGGHTDGEIASAVTVQTLAYHIIEGVVLPQLEGQQPNAGQKTIPEVLADAMTAANDAVQIQVPNGGTTATCVVVRGDLGYIAHVGDSRAYLIVNGQMELVTRDHSLVRRLQELGQLTADEAETHPQRNVLYRAIGQGEALEVDAATRRLPPSSRLLICSDGLWGVVDADRLLEIILNQPDPQQACDRMIEEANANGGPDNITVILVQMPD